MDIKTLIEISKASTGAMTADVAVLGLKQILVCLLLLRFWGYSAYSA